MTNGKRMMQRQDARKRGIRDEAAAWHRNARGQGRYRLAHDAATGCKEERNSDEAAAWHRNARGQGRYRFGNCGGRKVETSVAREGK